MEEVVYEGTELLARAFCHEIDHLDGKMYTELVEGELHRTVYDERSVVTEMGYATGLQCLLLQAF